MPRVSKVGASSSPSRTGVMDRIKPMSFNSDEGIKVLLYGRSGTGKTTMWATFPGKILGLACSGSRRTGELRSIDTPEYRKKIDTVNIDSPNELSEIVEALENKELPHKTVVLDHCTGYQDLTLANILGLDEIPAMKSWGMADIKEYGQCTQQCMKMWRDMFSLQQNVVFIAQERVHKEDGTRGSELISPIVGAGLMPGLTTFVHSTADYVCQTFIRQKEVTTVQEVGDEKIEMTEKISGEVEYCMRIGPHPVFYTKFRKPKGTKGSNATNRPDIMVDPSYDKLMKVIGRA